MNFSCKAEEYAAALEGGLDHPPVNYLENRWITKGISRLYGLGYAEWAEAISLPHHDLRGNVVGIRLRYIGTDKSRGRYISHKGSSIALLGVPQLRGWSTLFITEGEFNALTVASVRGNMACDVLSIGSGSAVPADLIEIASRYKRLVLMVDDQQCADLLIRKLEHPRVGIWLSRVEDGRKLDANALLDKYGPDFLRDVICMEMYALEAVPFPELPVDCASLMHVRSLQAAADALTSFRIPGKMFDQLWLQQLLRRQSLDLNVAQQIIGRLVSDVLLYEEPVNRTELRATICLNLAIDESLIYLPAPIRSFCVG